MANFDEVYREPFERCLTRFRDQLTPTRLRDLKRDGRVVIDNFLGRGWALALLQEIRWLHGQGWVGFGLPKRGRGVVVLEKGGLYRLATSTEDDWLSRPAFSTICLFFSDCWSLIVSATGLTVCIVQVFS